MIILKNVYICTRDKEMIKTSINAAYMYYYYRSSASVGIGIG